VKRTQSERTRTGYLELRAKYHAKEEQLEVQMPVTEVHYESLWRYVERELETGPHDMHHVRRVYGLSLQLGLALKNVNLDVLLPAAILHDIARKKEDELRPQPFDHAEEGAKMAYEVLQANRLDEFRDEICYCIRAHRYRGPLIPSTLEAQVLSDADKLDGVGAVGIARTFMWSGKVGAPLYSNVDIEDYKRMNLDENGRFIKEELHASNLEYELKLKRIGERLFTDQARAIFDQRIRFMNLFFETLKGELDLRQTHLQG
jgi:uncharacterized protein